jgi:hypothetical protein
MAQVKISFGLISPAGQFWTEAALAEEGDKLGACLEKLKPLYGQLQIVDEEADESVAIVDDFDAMMFDICIGNVAKLSAGETVTMTLAAHNETVTFAPSEDQIEVSGSTMDEFFAPRAALLAALLDCGGRYLALKRADQATDAAVMDKMQAALKAAQASL